MVERTLWIILVGSLMRVLDDALCSTNSQLLVYIIYRDSAHTADATLKLAPLAKLTSLTLLCHLISEHCR